MHSDEKPVLHFFWCDQVHFAAMKPLVAGGPLRWLLPFRVLMLGVRLQMAAIPRPDRAEQLEEGARLQHRLLALGAPLSAETIEQLLVQPGDVPMDELMLRLPQPGVPRDGAGGGKSRGGKRKKKRKKKAAKKG